MCRGSLDEVRSFNKYLLFYGPEDERSGLKGIRSDAPPEVIEDFLQWYRDNNRYPNGRMRPKDRVFKELVIDVRDSVL